MSFSDRREAGRHLARRIAKLDLVDPVVVAIPRGGVPVGIELALALGAPLDVLVVRKLGAPGKAEYAVGAIAETAVHVIDPETLELLGVREEQLGPRVARETAELARLAQTYRSGRPPRDVAGRTAILVTDGLDTPLTAMAAAEALRKREARRIVLAAPVCAARATAVVGSAIDELVCLRTPEDFMELGLWYDDFATPSEKEVMRLLLEADTALGKRGLDDPVGQV